MGVHMQYNIHAKKWEVRFGLIIKHFETETEAKEYADYLKKAYITDDKIY